MTARQHIDTYLEGWRTGDGPKSLSVVTPDFHYDDPNTGRIYQNGLVDFMEAFKLVRAPEYYYYRDRDTTSCESPKRMDPSFTPIVLPGSSRLGLSKSVEGIY